jgi:hypothetical protein
VNFLLRAYLKDTPVIPQKIKLLRQVVVPLALLLPLVLNLLPVRNLALLLPLLPLLLPLVRNLLLVLNLLLPLLLPQNLLQSQPVNRR